MKDQAEITLSNIRTALDSENIALARQLLNKLHPADQADAISDRPLQEQTEMIPTLSVNHAADVLEHLDEDEAAEIAAKLPLETLAHLLDEMEPDEAADILLDLYEERASAVMAKMSSIDNIRPLLEHDDDTAGGRMTTQVPVLDRGMTASHAIAYLRNSKPDSEVHYYLYVTDKAGKLLGILGLRELITAKPSTNIETIMNSDVISASVDDDEWNQGKAA